jgi:hypothetical protein
MGNENTFNVGDKVSLRDGKGKSGIVISIDDGYLQSIRVAWLENDQVVAYRPERLQKDGEQTSVTQNDYTSTQKELKQDLHIVQLTLESLCKTVQFLCKAHTELNTLVRNQSSYNTQEETITYPILRDTSYQAVYSDSDTGIQGVSLHLPEIPEEPNENTQGYIVRKQYELEDGTIETTVFFQDVAQGD